MNRKQQLQENRNQLNDLAKVFMKRIDLTTGADKEFWNDKLGELNRRLHNIKVELGEI